MYRPKGQNSSQESWYSDSPEVSPVRGTGSGHELGVWRRALGPGSEASVNDDGDWVSVRVTRVLHSGNFEVEGVDEYGREYDMEVKPTRLFKPRQVMSSSIMRNDATHPMARGSGEDGNNDDDDFVPLPQPRASTKPLKSAHSTEMAASSQNQDAARARAEANRLAALEKRRLRQLQQQQQQQQQQSHHQEHQPEPSLKTGPIPTHGTAQPHQAEIYSQAPSRSAPSFSLAAAESEDSDSDDSDSDALPVYNEPGARSPTRLPVPLPAVPPTRTPVHVPISTSKVIALPTIGTA